MMLAGWLQQRPTLLSLCDREDRENDDAICYECVVQKREVNQTCVHASVCLLPLQ